MKPKVGEFYRKNGYTVVIHQVTKDQVYAAKFTDHGRPVELIRCTVDEFFKDAPEKVDGFKK